ncbi:hypothetical protein [Streptomyces hiroshimensis]|uniref:Uncharacterized protein n=1 Tax=Streptomyces hiroshimensis TaxID=66424 RepID=A0ABQ2YMH1_9ACTN|nr:hypothetical protein [Streptomyces hiroshimensis]GGX87160.1 hypothetical protein GCM10010324_35820 [Streptomyces hiroshimensis]
MTLQSFSKWAIGIISAVLALGLLALFFCICLYIVSTADTPPRLADPAPSGPPSHGPDGALPSQFRGAYDPSARLLGLLAIVSPLLTTIVGFYFGQRAGAASGEAARSEAEKKRAKITSALQAEQQNGALKVLRDKGLVDPPNS